MTQWVKFWLLALVWGSSFLLIKIGVEELGPFPLVSIRIGGAAALFAVYLYVTRRALPAWGNGLGALLFVGIFNTAVPFSLISWGETRIDSSMATVLNATVPLFNLIIAHFLLADERLTTLKISGLMLGFVGVIVLVSGGLNNVDVSLLGQSAVLLASLSYAAAIVTIRYKLRHLDPFTTAGWSLVIGALTIIPITVVVATPLPTDVSAQALMAAVTLATVNTFVAYFLFYSLIADWGVRASLVTYALPPIGVTLGFLVLDETIDWRLIVGGIMIVMGIVVTKSDSPLSFRNRLRLWRVGSNRF
jgi:drug/metabolite transporter (DMT)-like permease